MYINMYLSQYECLFRYVVLCPNEACMQCCHFTLTVSCCNIFRAICAILVPSACWTLCCTSHINMCVTTVFLPLLGFCISHKGPVNLLNTVVPARMISVFVEFFHVLGSSWSLSFCRRTWKWRSSGLFTSTVCKCNFGVWTISQVDLLVFHMALEHQQVLCKWFGFTTVCDVLPWNEIWCKQW
jgi:hypothetical protein